MMHFSFFSVGPSIVAVDVAGWIRQYRFEWHKKVDGNIAGWQACDGQVGAEIECATQPSQYGIHVSSEKHVG